MNVIYLSGPISLNGTATATDTTLFTARFAEEEARLNALGYSVINPCNCPREDSWEAYMRHAIRAVADADVVAVLPRWAESRGSALEVYIATQLGIPVVPAAEIVTQQAATTGEDPEADGEKVA